jgi:hypothetical protein
MSVHLSLPAALLLAAGIASAAAAQPANPPVADPATPVPTLQYQSVFSAPGTASTAAARTAPARTDWREANDRAREAGGHGGALKEDEGTATTQSMQHQMPRHPMPQDQMPRTQMQQHRMPQMHPQHQERRP